MDVVPYHGWEERGSEVEGKGSCICSPPEAPSNFFCAARSGEVSQGMRWRMHESIYVCIMYVYMYVHVHVCV